MSLYRLDPDIEQLLTKERFASDEFSVRQFIETMSNSQAHAMADNELDPKPYIRTFEAVARELEKLLDEATEEERIEEARAAEFHEQHNLNVVDVAGNVEDGLKNIKHLDTQITEISRATLQMSEQLNRLSQEHESVISLRTLVQYYINFEQKGESPELLRLWSSEDPADHRKCANIVGKLQVLASKINIQATQDRINEFAENLEQYLVSLFQEAYAAFDLVGMQEIAQVLYDFNQGSSAVKVFVNQHAFFMQIDDEETVLQNKELWEQLANPQSDSLAFEQLMAKMIDEITDTVLTETEVITRVFPRPTQVLSVFIQRVFAQYIQGKVLLYIQEAENHSLLAEARVLCVCYEKISTMVKNFKDSWNKHKIDPVGELGQVLDANFADIFTMTVNDRYFTNMEMPILIQITNEVFGQFFKAHNMQPDRLSKSVRLSSSGGGASTPPLGHGGSGSNLAGGFGGSDDEDEDEGAMNKLMRVMRTNTLHRSKSSRDISSGEVSIESQDLRVVLSAVAETVGRLQILRPNAGSVRAGSDLFDFLMQSVALRYINVALEDALARTTQDVRTPIDWQFLDTVNRVAKAVQLVSASVKSVLFEMVRSSDSRLAEMSDKINQYVDSTQALCGEIIENAMDLYQQRLRNIFSRQKRRDYAPREGDHVALDKPSETAVEVVSLLSDVFKHAQRALFGPNFDSFLHSLAVCLYEELLVHLKKNQVNAAGAQMLEIDIAAYEHVILGQWKIDEADMFATLRALAKVFSADIRLLASLLKDSRLARFKASELREFVMLRPDFYTRNLNMLFLGYRYVYRT